MKLFVITDLSGREVLDLTQRIELGTYQVNKQWQYEEWEDSNYTKHKERTCRKGIGSFTLKFFSIDEYREFVTAIENNTRSDGSTQVRVYYNNLMNTDVANMFIDFEPKNDLPSYGVRADYEGIDITVEEREDWNNVNG